jgi:hypothetical protein
MRRNGARDYFWEPCEDRGRKRQADRFVGIPPTPMCDACAYGLPDPEAQGMSAGQALVTS